jgi:hypothetical protein
MKKPACLCGIAIVTITAVVLITWQLTHIRDKQAELKVQSLPTISSSDVEKHGKNTQVVEVWLGKSIAMLRGPLWPRKNGVAVPDVDLAGLATVRLHFGDHLIFQSDSVISFFDQRHDRVASVKITPVLSARGIDESFGLVRQLGKSAGKTAEVELQIEEWRDRKDKFNRTGRLEFDDGSSVFIDIRPVLDNSGEWYLSLHFFASWYLDDGRRRPCRPLGARSCG